MVASPALSQPADADALAIPNFWRAGAQPAPLGETPFAGIRFVTPADYPPFNFLDAAGRLTGFNVDLARAICDELALPCTIQARPWNDLLIALGDDRADAAIAGVALTTETAALARFSDVYLKLPGRFVVRRGLRLNISPEELANRRVAVVAGSAHEAFLQTYFPAVRIQPHPTALEAEAALRLGDADVLFGDGLQLAFWLEGIDAADCCIFAGGPYLDSHFFGEGLAVAVAPDDNDLRVAINGALAALAADGTYAELYLRYFPLSFY
jgi:polar amino acid transport system substrate-binding protein